MRISDWSSDVCSSDLRVGVRQGGDGGDATGYRRVLQRRQRLHVLLARLPGLDAHVDQAGRQAAAAAVDHLDVFLDGVDEHAGPDLGDAAVAHQDRALDVKPGGGTEQAGVLERKSVVEGKGVAVRVNIGGGVVIKKK